MKTTRSLLILFFLGLSAFAESQVPPPPPPPPSGSGKINKADSLVNEGDIRGAIAEYKKMYNLNPGDSRTAYNYACVLSRNGQADSAFRYLNLAVMKLGPGSPVVSALRRLQTMINDNNLKDLESLLSQKYISMFEKCCRENEANWQQYALMFDRMRMNQDKPQRFGTHSYLDPSKGRTDELYPLENESKVDDWRKEIGLEPLKDYPARTGIKYAPAAAAK